MFDLSPSERAGARSLHRLVDILLKSCPCAATKLLNAPISQNGLHLPVRHAGLHQQHLRVRVDSICVENELNSLQRLRISETQVKYKCDKVQLIEVSLEEESLIVAVNS